MVVQVRMVLMALASRVGQGEGGVSATLLGDCALGFSFHQACSDSQTNLFSIAEFLKCLCVCLVLPPVSRKRVCGWCRVGDIRDRRWFVW